MRWTKTLSISSVHCTIIRTNTLINNLCCWRIAISALIICRSCTFFTSSVTNFLINLIKNIKKILNFISKKKWKYKEIYLHSQRLLKFKNLPSIQIQIPPESIVLNSGQTQTLLIKVAGVKQSVQSELLLELPHSLQL